MNDHNTYRGGPDEAGHFGEFGGRFVAETLMPLILELESAYRSAKDDPMFAQAVTEYFNNYVGRPVALI